MLKLPMGQRLQLVKWAVKSANESWDKEIAADAANGKLDFHDLARRTDQRHAAIEALHDFDQNVASIPVR